MPMPSCRDADVNTPLWVCHNVNAFYLTQMQFNQKFLLFSKSRLPRSLEPLDLFFLKIILFYSDEAWMPSASFLPQKMFYFDLGFPKNWWSLLEIYKWDINLRSGDLVRKDLFSQFDWEKGVARFQGFFLETRILWKSYILKDSFFQSLNMMIWSSVETHIF